MQVYTAARVCLPNAPMHEENKVNGGSQWKSRSRPTRAVPADAESMHVCEAVKVGLPPLSEEFLERKSLSKLLVP